VGKILALLESKDEKTRLKAADLFTRLIDRLPETKSTEKIDPQLLKILGDYFRQPTDDETDLDFEDKAAI
jgi:hypothetical protein